MRANQTRLSDWHQMKDVKQCNRCGCPVAWDRNRHGQPYLVDVKITKDTEGHVSVTREGIFHKCKGTIAEQIERTRAAIAACEAELAAIDPDDWYNPKQTIEQAIAANQQKLAELTAMQ